MSIFILCIHFPDAYDFVAGRECCDCNGYRAAVVVFQPELRRALEKLGEKKFLTSVVPFDMNRESVRFGDETIEGIVSASFSMGKVKTGALIVVEQAIKLTEYESTGIKLDCIVSKQVLINIFEHNTPLHDGAIIVRGRQNRVGNLLSAVV